MVAEKLDSLKSRFSGCETVAFADIATGMILVANTDTKLDRGALNDLCLEASVLLGTTGEPAIGISCPNSAVRRTPTETVIFLRSEQEPNDVLISVCGPDMDIRNFFADALDCLSAIGLG